MGQPASDVGLLHALSDEPRKLLIWDEFGIALRSIRQQKQAMKTRILATIMDLYSASKRKYRAKNMQDQRKRKGIDIDKPNAFTFGSFHACKIFDSLSRIFVEDGFLPRIFISRRGENSRKKKKKESQYTKISNQNSM